MTSPPPILVLSGHRTGSSAIAGLLAASGLHVGELIPASLDNRGGYYENKHVLQTSRSILARRSRDWTCPPLRLDVSADDVTDVKTALADVMAADRLSGFKDPRTLFLLPAWLEVLPAVRLVGVSRPIVDVAASIQRRDGFPSEVAIRIAEAHESRLRLLQDQLGFPVIEFGTDPAATLHQVEHVVGAIDGLTWDSQAAEAFFDPALVHHQSMTTAADLAASGTTEPIPAANIMRALNQVAYQEVPEFAMWAGPAYLGRRKDAENLALRAREQAGVVIEVVPSGAESAARLRGSVPLSIDELLAGNPVELASHVLATDVLDYVAPASLPALLFNLAEVVDDDGVCVLGGFVLDLPKVPESNSWSGAAALTRRNHPPYHHHRSELEAALLNTPWRLGHFEPHDGRRSRILLVKSELRRWPHIAESHELRSRWPEMESTRREAQERAAAVGRDLREAGRSIRELNARIIRLEEERTRNAAALAERESELRAEVEGREAVVSDLRKSLEELEQAKDRLTQELQEARAATAAAKESARNRKRQLDKTASRLEKLRNRRSVRFALGLSALGRPVFRAVRRLRRRGPTADTHKDTARPLPAKPLRPVLSSSATSAAIRKQRAGVGVAEGPLVSIVVVTRNGQHHLARLLPGLRDRTLYRNFELVVVDNGSTDDTTDLLAQDWRFPVRVIRNDHNTSFSRGNNQGVAAATGELVLLLNNDVDPINPEWLGAMVETLTQSEGCGAAGALLIYPEYDGADPPEHVAELSVQHRGIRFTWQDGVPRAINLGRGEDPTNPELNRVVEMPAATAACLLMRVDVMQQVGGLSEDYVYGTEDVELGLKLRNAGLKTLVDGRAALFHHEFGTQDTLSNELKRINRIGNRQAFIERWGPRLSRTLRADALEAPQQWLSGDRPVVAITLTRDDPAAGWGDWYTANELGDAMQKLGWDVVYAERYKDRWYELGEDVHVVISLLDTCDASRLPQGAYKIAWVRNWVDRWVSHDWIDDYDLVLASSDRALEIIRDQTRHTPHKLPLATNIARFSPQAPHPTYESDYVFTGNYWGKGRELIDMLEVRPGEKFMLFGKGWEKVPRVARYWRGHLPYDELPALYSNAKIVLDDTAAPTKPYGAVNSRVFDAIASGALVISDNVIGAKELFGDLLPTYTSRSELRAHLDRFLSDAAMRQERVDQLRSIVQQRHTYDAVAEQVVAIARRAINQPKIAIKIGPPNHDVAEAWGDTHFARAFARALNNTGFLTDIQILPEWDAPDRQDADVVVHLRGLVPYVPRPSAVNVLWIISHPEDVSAGECDQYDLVLVASETEATRLEKLTETPVFVMHQATDATRFSPKEADPDLATELLFVGNSRKTERPSITWAIDAELPITIYGADWDGIIDERYVKDTYFPNERLSEAYASAKIVLNDHWPDMRASGIVSNRIFDALSCGAFVISDAVVGIDEVFAGAVPTFTSKKELRKLVTYYLEATEERERLARKGMEIVRERHTFDARAEQFADLVLPLLEGRRLTID